MFHLGALTRLNELGLLAGTETICAVSGASILASLLATRVPWPLQGAYREWPEQVAEPLREICARRGRRVRLRPSGDAAHAERYARELAGCEGGLPEWPRIVFGAAGLELGQMAGRESGEREPGVRWELGPLGRASRQADPLAVAVAAIAEDLSPLTAEEREALENHGYRLADAALRRGAAPAALEPQPPLPPHPHWRGERRVGGQERRGTRRLVRLGRRRSAPTARTLPGGSEAAELLLRHRPFVKYDSLECYRPESVATIAELAVGSRCNTLHRANGELLASVLPVEGAARLDLDYLGAPTYADGRPAQEDDYLDEAGGSHADDALAARQRAGRDEVVYGRATWSRERLWLQYWFFYYYNDKGFLQAGRHEGDWETMQLRIGVDGIPDAVVYGQHAGGKRCAWEEAERQRGEEGAEAPIVYCARGSHASLAQPGTHPAPIAPDHNDGLGPQSRPRLIEIGEDAPGWVRWPGRWGSTRRREAFECDSPRGPAHRPHWRDPAELHADACPTTEAQRWQEPPPPTPRFEARREGNHAVLVYSFGETAGASAPARIVAAGVAGGNDAVGVVHSFGLDGRVGACALPVPAGAAVQAIRACVVSELGAPGPTLTVPLTA
jgi:hypothetical protein